MVTSVAETADAISESLREVIGDAQDLLDTLRKEGAEKYGETYHRLQSNLERARERLDNTRRWQMRRIHHAARVADETVHEHPYAIAGTAMIAGAVAGALTALLLARR